MRELTLWDTGYLCGGLLLSLVLPLMLSWIPAQDELHRKSCLATVWFGQIWLALAGIVILVSAAASHYAAVLGTVGYLVCARFLYGKLHRLRQNG